MWTGILLIWKCGNAELELLVFGPLLKTSMTLQSHVTCCWYNHLFWQLAALNHTWDSWELTQKSWIGPQLVMRRCCKKKDKSQASLCFFLEIPLLYAMHLKIVKNTNFSQRDKETSLTNRDWDLAKVHTPN